MGRTWLLDPLDVEARVPAPEKRRRTWNGQDFYVSVGEGPHRTWEDCVKYGFVSAGQGKWYSRSLEMLFPGARIFVYVPGAGYVAVGTVTETATPIRDFKVMVDGLATPILDIPDIKAPKMWENKDDPDRSEYAVGVKWIKYLPVEQAIRERGLFANQNSACRLRDQHTIDYLSKSFGLDD